MLAFGHPRRIEGNRTSERCNVNSVTVIAKRWKYGWDLRIVGGGATQVRTLDRAVQQVIDYLDTTYEDVDHSDWKIDVVPHLGSVIKDVKAAKKASKKAAKATKKAAKQVREVVAELRAQGISVTDAAAILGVSRARVSQLAQAA